MGYDPIDTDETDNNADKEITVDAINGADTSAAAAGEALTSDGSGSFIFAEVGGDTFTQMSEFLNQANMSQIAASQSDMQQVINTGLFQNISASQTAMQEVAASQVAMQEVINSPVPLTQLVNSPIAMQEVADSQTAFQEVINSPTALQAVLDSEIAMQQVAASQTAMQEVANSQTLLDKIGNNATVQNTVYNNNTAISALNSSNLVSSASSNIFQSDTSSLKNDRVILLSHTVRNGGFATNQPVFTDSSNDIPQTADRIRRENNQNFGSRVNHTATFIDISDS